MNLLTATLLFITIGCAYSQYDMDDINRQLEQATKNLNKQLETLQKQGNGQFDQLGIDLNNLGRPYGSNNNQFSQTAQAAQVFEQQYQQIVSSFRSKCQSNGHAEVFDELEAEIAKTGECLKNSVNTASLQNDFNQAVRTNDLQSFFKKICTVWPDVHKCVNPIVSKVKMCLDPKEAEAVDKSLDVLDDINTFLCENNAHRVMDFIENNGMQCFEQRKGNIQNCLSKVMEKRQNNNAMITYDEGDCSDFRNMRRCIVDELSRCSSSVPSKIVDDFFGVVSKTGCNSASNFSWSAFVSIFLLCVTYLFSKMF